MARGLIVIVAAITLYWMWGPPGDRLLAASSVDRVYVTNFPGLQRVEGAVTVSEPIPRAVLARRQALVSPGGRTQVATLTPAPPLEAAGFTSVVLSLAGEVKASTRDGGSVGVLLVPDEPEILRVFETHGELLFSLEVQAAVVPGSSGRFHSDQPSVRLGFPRYRVFFYNSTERAVEATLYAYLGS